MQIKSRPAFFIRAYNDIDHFVPVIAEFIKKEHRPMIIINSDLEIDSDYRVKYLKTLGEFEVFRDLDYEFARSNDATSFFSQLKKRWYLLKRKRAGIIGRLHRRFFFSCEQERDFLISNEIDVCIFEWSTPFQRGEKVERYFTAARAIGLTTFSIPHGCNVFINSDVTVDYRRKLLKGEFIDQSDRRYFDYFILQNPIRRDGWIKWGLDPIRTQAWGSVRFDPGWAKQNLEICPKFQPECIDDKKLKVVFMQFQKDYNVLNSSTMLTLRKLSNLDGIALVVKDATREGKAFYDRSKAVGDLGGALYAWYGNEVHSPALIQWADCIVVIGGSIGIEGMLQNKRVIYPTYLNTNLTMYEYFNAAHCVGDFDELRDILVALQESNEVPWPEGRDRMLTEIIYAGESPFNVPDFYYRMMTAPYLNYTHKAINVNE